MSMKTRARTKMHLGQHVLLGDNLVNVLDQSKGSEQSFQGMKMIDILLNQTTPNTPKSKYGPIFRTNNKNIS